jgi:tetratricopeptide (TPR) repeat protein
MSAITQPESTADVDAQNPWPGLVAFTESLRDYFHGRVDEAEDLLRRVNRKNLTVLFGQSGLGKSSLLQAGLFPRLRAEGYLPVPIRLDHAPDAPSLADQVEIAAARAIAEAGARPRSTPADHADALWEFLHRRGLILETDDGRPIHPVLVFDQFEELFAIGQASEETRSRAAAFLTELADFVENRAPEELERRLDDAPELARQFDFDDRGYRVLVCLREDYLPHLEGLRRAMPSVTENRMRLTRMNGERALDAVAIPGGDLITPEVGRQIVGFVAGGRFRRADCPADGLAEMEVEPSLLSLVCRELNNRRLEAGLPQITADLLAGNRERILQDFYERCVADQPAEVRAFVEDELVTDSGLRENIALERARKALTARGAPDSALDALVKRRLLHLEDRLDIQRVELTHDVLTAVVKKSRDERQAREATDRAEREARLAREKARLQRRRLRTIVAWMTAALIVVSAFGVFSFLEWREAVRQREQARRARAEAVREKNKAEESQALAMRRFDEKRQAMDTMLAQFGDKRLSGMPGTQPIRKALFERGVEMYEAMSRERQNDPKVQLNLVERYVELGRLQSEIGTLDEALAPLKKGEAVLRRLVAEASRDREYRFRLGALLYQIGYCYWEHRKSEPGVPVLRESVQILGKLSDEDPRNYEYALYLAMARIRLGAVVPQKAEYKDLHRVAYDSLEKLVAERPDDTRALTALERVAVGRGLVAVEEDRPRDAEPFFERARGLAERAIAIDPTDQVAFTYLKYAVLGLSHVYARTDRLARGIDLLKQVVADLGKRANANPAVAYYQGSLVYSLDELRKLYQLSGEHDKAVECLQEIIRISDGLIRRNPQEVQPFIDSVNAANALVDIYRNSRRQGEAVAALDKVIKQSDEFMRLHPDSDTLLANIVLAHRVPGELSFEVEQYDRARDAYKGGVDLFRRYRPSMDVLDNWTPSNYLVCCRGLIGIAKQRKQFKEAIDLASRLIVPIKFEAATTSDDMQALLGELIGLSTLYEDTGNVKEALRLRVLAVDRSRKALGGDQKSNWYMYQQVFGAHQHLARLYKKVGDDRHEFEALRDYFRETEPYVREKDHSALLAETAAFTPRNLARLREAFGKFYAEGGMKRFTIPVDFNGIKAPFYVYVTDSWQFLDDQFTWVERIRGGKVPKDIIESFQRLYKIAKGNKVSFMDLCVYALGSTGKVDDRGDTPITLTVAKKDALVVAKELAEAKQAVEAGREDSTARRRLALKYVTLAAEEVATSNFFRAFNLLAESRGYLKLNSLEQLGDERDRDVLTYFHYVRGALLACTGQPEKGYSEILECIRTGPARVVPEFAISAGSREFALGWITMKVHRPMESAVWYHKAMELGHRFGASRLYHLYVTNPQIVEVLSAPLPRLLLGAKAAAAKDESVPEAFARLIAEEKTRASREALAAAARDREALAVAARNRSAQIKQLEELASHYHDLAEANTASDRRNEYRKALSREYDLRGGQVKLDPRNFALKTAQGNVAATMARSHADSREHQGEVEWTDRAARLYHPESMLQLAEWYEKGANGYKADAKQADHFRYLGHYIRGFGSFGSRRYAEALPDLIKVCESREADPDDHDRLGQCYGKLGRWDEAIKAYTRSLELDVKGDDSAGRVLNTLEALIVAEKPEQLLGLIESVKARGWTLPKTGSGADKYGALYHGFRAMALISIGKDASEAERSMRAFTGKKGFAATGWTWDELDGWLKRTKLAADRKVAAEKILSELKGEQLQGR